MQKSSNHTFIGLQLDAAVSKLTPEYLIDAHNIRITARGGETLLTVTNERGPKELTMKNSLGGTYSIQGTIIGHCVLNNYLVLFVHLGANSDSILRIDMSESDPLVTTLFPNEGLKSLGFDVKHPIEAIGDYENENIQKVYWTDGLNQPRIINIMHSPYDWEGSFDFVPELELDETVNVTRVASSGGLFPPGVIQYAFTYYNKYGQETNIFHTTPLLYTSFNDRGGSPEATVSNAFEIEVSNVDKHFDYLRIYSILRTSLDAIPTCKRVQDIELSTINNRVAKFTDTGTVGDTVDPSSLLYIGGEEVIADSMCAKDGTLFLGNLKIKRQAISSIDGLTSDVKDSLSSVNSKLKGVSVPKLASSGYVYYNALNALETINGVLYNTTAAGFKNREYYRLGIQAQYKDGKWSEPVWIGDYKVGYSDNNAAGPYYDNDEELLYKFIMTYELPSSVKSSLKEAGYKKVRPVVVFPEIQDRTIICLGVVNPTVYTRENRFNDMSIYALSSWFFRPFINGVTSLSEYAKASTAYSNTVCSPFSANGLSLPYTSRDLTWNPLAIRGVEIQGQYKSDNLFKVDWSFLTFHSPDIELDESLHNLDLSSITCSRVGKTRINYTASDIDIQTETPPISNGGSGFVHKPFTSGSSLGIISGLFYDDYAVDEVKKTGKLGAYGNEYSPYKWLVYTWGTSGSLNNDINRPTDLGTRSAVLSKKTISNLRFADTTVWTSPVLHYFVSKSIPLLFSSNEVSIVKLSGNVYEGNIDTLLVPDDSDGSYFAFSGSSVGADTTTDFNSTSWWKTWSAYSDESSDLGLYKRLTKNGVTLFYLVNSNIGDAYPALAVKKESVRLKYKSTPHVVLELSSPMPSTSDSDYTNTLPVVELCRSYNAKTMFGGTSTDALRANVWLPAGKTLSLFDSSNTLEFEWGDTWFSRYDCLKTYPFTAEDPNRVVEIGSFLLETRINIDGRYDRNRGLLNNLNMSPTNFNLMNPVYSLKNNFFSYRMLDDDYYKLNEFPNLITWSTEKSQGSDVDPWTSVTLASTYDMDGSKGKIRALDVWSDNIYCFLDNGICNILFNSRVLIPTSDGVPIEISNNYKVDGKRYISDGVGCINKFSICSTPNALYFIDSVGGHLQAIGGLGLSDVSVQRSMVTWLNQLPTSMWTPKDYTVRLFYDKNNNDLYINTVNESLCYSELLGLFTSFMSYPDVPIMFNVVDKFFCVKNNYLHLMFEGGYNYFFGEYQGYDISFISNGKTSQLDLSAADKIFTNIEFRADRWSDKLDSILSSESPFDYVRVWNEYQDTGEVLLRNKGNLPSNLKKKFRVWRIQIPRDAHNRRDRIRNTWCKITLGSAPRYNNGNNGFILLHDLDVLFYI